MITLVCCPVDKFLRKWPFNIILLTVLAFFEGVSLGVISTYYEQESIMIAGGLTTLTVLVVTIFAFFTKIDFTKCGGIVLVFLILLFFFGFAVVISYFFLEDDFSKYVLKMVYGAVGAFVMVFCLIYDTSISIH